MPVGVVVAQGDMHLLHSHHNNSMRDSKDLFSLGLHPSLMPWNQWKPMTGFKLLRASWILLIVKAMIEYSLPLISCKGKHTIGRSPSLLLIQSRRTSAGKSFAEAFGVSLSEARVYVREYLTKFTQLSRYAPDDVDKDDKKQDCFREGLNLGLRYALSSSDYRSF
ncbi:hypothetical protein U9M48_024768 [Paspalum notatum var. saurae]|uniref:Uncharacterized protein n=1 Tax=Paspalum notatum var. saurae TaxID=547442 RepID=A0AAQ3TRE5_PASNO